MADIVGSVRKVLDHGFVRVVDTMGDDSSIVQAARVSYGEGTRTLHEDEQLIRYLMRHKHTTPFEMCDIKFHIKLPIFVARQWIRHRTSSFNEYSARYSIVKDEFYVPNVEHVQTQSVTNKQGRGDKMVPEQSNKFVRDVDDISSSLYDYYEEYVEQGVSRELARIVLPLNVYTEWYWKTNLHNLLHFLALRMDEHAQYEIRQYAGVISTLIARWVPWTYDAWLNYVYTSKTFSFSEVQVLLGLIGDNINLVTDDIKPDQMTNREWSEFKSKLGVM